MQKCAKKLYINVPSTKLILVARFQSQGDISGIKYVLYNSNVQRTKLNSVPSYKTYMSDHILSPLVKLSLYPMFEKSSYTVPGTVYSRF